MTGPPKEVWPRDGRNVGGPGDSEQPKSTPSPTTSRFFQRLGIDDEIGHVEPFDSWRFAISYARGVLRRDRADARCRVLKRLEFNCNVDVRGLLKMDECDRALRQLDRLEEHLAAGGDGE